jgi:ribonuclease BN (tRNA processing enzyme)
MSTPPGQDLIITFAGSGDAFGSGGRYQACIHLQRPGDLPAVLLDCGATSLSALKRMGLDPGQVAAVFISHLHGDHFAGLPFLILDGQFSRRTSSLTVAGPPGMAQRLTDTMECLFPGSSTTPLRFETHIVELDPGGSEVAIAGVSVSAWEVDHPSGAPPLALRLTLGGKTIAYTGDTGWTDSLVDCAAGADLLIAEAYYREKNVPYHLRELDLETHKRQLSAKRVILTHMSSDMLDRQTAPAFESAHDGYVLIL